MKARTIRRAQERSARKLARKEQFVHSTAAAHPAIGDIPAAPPSEPLSQHSHSTGPTSAAGKAKSSLNALRTGLTGRTVLLPADDAAAYTQLLTDLAADLQPVGLREAALVLSIADALWRLERIPRLEMALFALGQERFAPLCEGHHPDTHKSLIETHTFLAYEKQLRNLHIQEGRIRRQRDRDLADLRQLQTERLSQAAPNVSTAIAAPLSNQAAEFVFTTDPSPAPMPAHEPTPALSHTQHLVQTASCEERVY